MKNSASSLCLVLAAGVSGSALFVLANASFTAAWRPDIAIALPSSLALAAFAIWDYSRRSQSSLEKPTRLLRPSLPEHATQKSTSYDNKSSHRKTLAA